LWLMMIMMMKPIVMIVADDIKGSDTADDDAG
jgi:hypothetical protein